MKNIMLVLVGTLTISLSTKAAPRAVLSEEKAQTIALIQARAMNVNDDVLSVIQNDVEPAYSIEIGRAHV